MLETLTFNLGTTPIRRETLHGRGYIVAPLAMLTEGVHNGSGGPLLYRESECRKSVPAWNMKPIVVYHPQINGAGVSACDPDILEKQQVGMVMNVRWDGKLRAEAWIEEGRATAVDDRVVVALEENRMMEVSTGLFTNNVGEPGEWGGKAYNAEATEHQPDHLALLPDQIGACSIADGAGLLQLNEHTPAGMDLTPLFARTIDELRRMVGNAMSHGNIYTALARALQERLGKKTEAWLVEVYDDFFIYEPEIGKKLFRLPYTATDTVVAIGEGEPEEVIRVTEYRTASGEFVGNAHRPQKENAGMDKKAMVDGLIANAKTQFGEDDRDTLMALDAAVLEKMAPVDNADNADEGGENPPADPTNPNPPENREAVQAAAESGAEGVEPEQNAETVEEYIAKAPEGMRDVLTNGLATHNAQRTALIEKITANKACKFTKEYLATKGLGELQGLAALAGVPETTEVANPPMFAGAATPAGPTANTEADEGGLDLPTMNFEKKPTAE